MSVTLNQSPSRLIGFRDPAVYVLYDSANYSLNKFRYLVELSVYDGSTWTAVALLKRYPNNSNAAVFDVANILKAQQRDLDAPLGPASTELFAVSNSAVRYRIQYGYESSTGPDTAPATTWQATESAVHYAIDARYLGLQHTIASGGIQSNYILDATDKGMLSLQGNEYRVSDTEKGSFSFISDDAISSDPSIFYIQFFNGSTGLGAAVPVTVSARGGVDPGVTDLNSVVQIAYLTPFYLEAQATASLKPSTYPTWTHYEVYAYGGGIIRSEVIKFVRDNDCKPYTPLRFMWKNRLGGWDQMYSTGKTRKKSAVKRTQLAHDRGNWFSAQGASSFEYSTQVSSVITELTREETYTLQFQPKDAGERRLVESLVEARHAFAWLYNADEATDETYYPIVILTNTVESLSSENDKVKTVSIEFRMANERAI